MTSLSKAQPSRSPLVTPLILWFMWFVGQILISLIILNIEPIPWRIGYTFREFSDPTHIVSWIGIRSNFDGYHYLTIANDGYSEPHRAFFPLFPYVLRYLSLFTGYGTFIVGLVVNSVLSSAACIAWYYIFREVTGSWEKSKSALITFLLFPTAFFLLCIYTESLFLLLFGLFVLGYTHKKTLLYTTTGVLIGLTRLSGVFVALIPITFLVCKWREEKLIRASDILAIASPFIGLSIYMIYLMFSAGDPLAFIHAQQGFNNARSTSIILLPQVLWRYFKIFVFARFDVGYFVALFEFLTFNGALYLAVRGIWTQIPHLFVNKNRYPDNLKLRIGLLLFSAANLILPTLTGTLSSIPRYALMSMGIFILIAEIPSKRIRTTFWIVSALLQITLFALFSYGYFVS